MRPVDYMRISVTDRCNLRCFYCMPPEGLELKPHSEILRFEEIWRIVVVATGLGFRKFRITGGEPLIVKDFINFIAGLSSIRGVEDLALTTNGILLGSFACQLKAAGLKRVNVSLDTLREDVFERICGSRLLLRVLDGIESAIGAGLVPVKLNCVVMRGINDNELLDFTEFTRGKPVTVRFIEHMPIPRMGKPGDHFVSGFEMERLIRTRFEIEEDPDQDTRGAARVFRLKGHAGKIGIIAPISRNFCDNCARVRLTADGFLRSCLLTGGEVSVKTALRTGGGDDEIARILGQVIDQKRAIGLHAQDAITTQRGMSQVGG